jgi:signal recognition particle subunit SRP54
VNQLVERFFEARKMMQQMAGSMGIPGMRRRTKAAKGKKGKKGKGRAAGPTPPKIRGGMPALPPGALDQLPPGATLPDLSKLNLPKGRG